MFAWISDNLANILITLALAFLVLRLILRMVRNKESDGSCAGCSGCAAHCHLKPDETKQGPDYYQTNE